MDIKSLIYIVVVILLSFYYYKKNFIKHWIKLPTNLRIFIEVFSAFLINGFIYGIFVMFLMLPIIGILIKVWAPLTIWMFLPYIILIINVILYYFILRKIIWMNPDAKEKAWEIASNVTWTVFGLMILVLILLSFIFSFISLS